MNADLRSTRINSHDCLTAMQHAVRACNVLDADQISAAGHRVCVLLAFQRVLQLSHFLGSRSRCQWLAPRSLFELALNVLGCLSR